jgi:hypothetical protein
VANRYWVGGTGTWDATAGSKWALTSGGAGGQAVPTTADNVFFDAASGANTVTIGAGTAVCNQLTMTGFTGTIAFGTNKITISGGGTVYTGATTFSVTGTPLIDCNLSGSTGRTISPAATTEANSISFNISAGTGSLVVNQSVKNLNFTGFTGTLSNSAKTIYGNLTLVSGMTITAGANATTFAATSGTQTITSAGQTMDFPITFAGTATYQLVDALTNGSTRTMTLTSGTLDLNNNTLTVGAFNSNNTNTRSILFGTGNITLSGSSGTLWTIATITGFSLTGTPTVNLTDTGAGTTRTITHTGGIASQAISVYVKAGGLTSTVAFGSTAAVYKTIDLTGFSGTFANSSIYMTGDLVVPSGVTITSTANAINFIGTGTQNITTNGTLMDLPLTVGRAIAPTTAATGNGTTATLTFGTTTLFPSVGSQIYVHGVTPSGYNGLYTVTASTATTVSYANSTTAAQTVGGTIDFYATVQLQDALTMGSTRQLALTSGIFNSNAKSVTCGTVNANNGNVKTLTITNTTFTVTGGTISSGFYIGSTNTSYNLTGSNIVFTTSGTANYYIGTAAGFVPQVTMSGSGQLAIGSNGSSCNITTLTNTVNPCTVSILSTANTLTVTNFNLSGTAGNLVTFNSSVAGTSRPISKSSGTVNALYLNVQDSTATGGAKWYANSSNDLGNNTGWNIFNNSFLQVF